MEPFDHTLLTKEQTRAVLKDKYLALYTALEPSFNHMSTAIRRHNKGHALWIEHDFFSENEYKIGDNSIAVRAFIGQHQAALKHAGIVAVGARDPSQDTWTGYAVE
jgi:hypothetical protein